jgi:4-hydroxy-tetrahydrodipicolinate reductase
VTVCGATGATGHVVVQRIVADPALALAGALAAPDDPAQGSELTPGVNVTADPAIALRGADVLVDFSTPEALAAVLDVLELRPIPLVVGTTGLPETMRARLDTLAVVVPVLMAPNMSIGVQLLRRLVRLAAAAAGPDWDVEIVELHHRRKVDAPSGTALALAADVAGALGLDPATALESGRHGTTGPRLDGLIGVQALRGGDVVGEHTVMLLGQGERLEIIHRATDRGTFAAGALRAARWLCAPGRPPGRYTIDDVLAR